MYAHAEPVRQGEHVVQEADEHDGRQAEKEVGVGRSTPDKPSQCAQVKDNPATTNRDFGVAAALIGFVNDIIPIGHAKIQEHGCK